MKEIHHANFILGKADSKDRLILQFNEDLNFDVRKNPDFLLLEIESFGIEESREIEAWAMGKPLLGEFKVCLIVTKSFTSEAQNALLKVLEEPPQGTFIYILMESSANLLPTFLSRLILSGIDGENNLAEIDRAEEFIKGDMEKRFSIIDSLLQGGDKNIMRDFIGSLELPGCSNLPMINMIASARSAA